MDELPEILRPYAAGIASTRKPILQGGFTTTRSLNQIGGAPWWPKDRPYPRSAAGAPLFLLIQIDFGTAPTFEPLPSDGLLQIFIDGWDGLYGLDFSDPFSGKGFSCCYHRETTGPVIRDFSFLATDRAQKSLLPFFRRSRKASLPLFSPLEPRFLSFSLGSMPVDPADYRFGRLLPEMERDEAAMDAYCDWLARIVPPIRLGGYPSFTQSDPREYRADLGDFTLLTVDTTDGIMWGDSGVAQFFLDEAALARKDFSRVAYNWDCC